MGYNIANMKLYLVRHGETHENAEGIVQGWLDTHLNENGIKQAEQLVESFNEPIEAIFSSDLQRAVETAEFFRAKYPSLPYAEDGRIRERYFGDAQGKKKPRKDWEAYWATVDTDEIAKNAETLTQLRQRVFSFIEHVKKSGYENVLVVTHAGVISCILSMGQPEVTHAAKGNASVTAIDLDPIR